MCMTIVLNGSKCNDKPSICHALLPIRLSLHSNQSTFCHHATATNVLLSVLLWIRLRHCGSLHVSLAYLGASFDSTAPFRCQASYSPRYLDTIGFFTVAEIHSHHQQPTFTWALEYEPTHCRWYQWRSLSRNHGGAMA